MADEQRIYQYPERRRRFSSVFFFFVSMKYFKSLYSIFVVFYYKHYSC